MKKIICLLLASAIALSMAGCFYVEQEPTGGSTMDPTGGVSTEPTGETVSPEGSETVTIPTAPGVNTPTSPGDPSVEEPPPEAIVLTPTETEKAQMESALGRTVDFDSGIFRYYGSYDGYLILYESVPCGERRGINIWGYTFADSNGMVALYAIRDGKANKLELLFDAGRITQEQIEQIHAVHTSYYTASENARLEKEFEYFYASLGSCHPAEDELAASIVSFIDEVFYTVKGQHLIVDDVRVRYYGKFNGYNIVFEERKDNTDTEIAIGPFTFHHYTGFEIWVMAYGEVYSLEDAYGQGLLSFRDIEDLYIAHRHYYWETDSEGYYRFAYTDWEDADSAALMQTYAQAIQGTWQSECYYDLTQGEQDIISHSYYYYGFRSDATGYKVSRDHGEEKDFETWHIVGATDRAVVFVIGDHDYDSYCGYYITDPESQYYQCVAFYRSYDGTYSIYRKISETAESAVPVGTQLWKTGAYYFLGTWTLADADYGGLGLPSVEEFCFNPDGTGYRILDGEKRALTWWCDGYTSSVGIQYLVDGDYESENLMYQIDPDEPYYQMLVQEIVDSGGFVLERKTGSAPTDSMEPAEPDGTVTFTNTAADLLGVWKVARYLYDGADVSGYSLELHIEGGGQGYVVQDGVTYPASWYQTGAAEEEICLECMWSVETVNGQINYVYRLRYITDRESQDYQQLICDVSDCYKGVLTKVSGDNSAYDGLGAPRAEAALNAALQLLGITAQQGYQWTCSYEAAENRYLITVNYGDTHYVFRVSREDAAVLSLETYPVTGVTPITARDYVLNYFGFDLNDVYQLSIGDIDTENKENVTVHIEHDAISYTVTLSFYGQILKYREYTNVFPDELDREDNIGWRAARDVCLDRKGITLEEMTKLSCYLYVSSTAPDDYSIWLDDDYNNWVCAHNGVCSDTFTYPSTAILTFTEISEIAFEDLGDSYRRLYEAGGCEVSYRVHYTGGAKANKPQFEYEWVLKNGDTTYVYRINAFTGAIQSKEISD